MAVANDALVILGATASGKSSLAMAVAESVGAEILSVDSMQVYRHMDIGTAKPTPEERSRVPHHGIDLVNPDESFTAARFVQLADAAIADAAHRNVPLIITGGTPLYYKVLFEGIFEGPAADPQLREKLAALGNVAMHQRLSTVDPISAARIHVNDTRRLIRALEVYELTGKPIGQLQQQWIDPAAPTDPAESAADDETPDGTSERDIPPSGNPRQMRHRAIWFGLNWDREQLNKRINARVKSMLQAGWLQETTHLVRRYGRLSPTAGEATGYALLIDHLTGKISLDEAAEQIKIATRQLARRQIKWIRRFPNVTWLDGALPLEQQVAAIRAVWPAAQSNLRI